MFARGVRLGGLNAAVLESVVSPAVRDSLGMVHYPGEGCRTLTSNNAPYLWIGGAGPVGGRFVSPSEMGCFMVSM